MLRTLMAVMLVLAACGCSRRPPIPQAFADCQAKAAKIAKVSGPEYDPEPFIADCMDARGYEIRAGDCSVVEDPGMRVGCYRRKYP